MQVAPGDRAVLRRGAHPAVRQGRGPAPGKTQHLAVLRGRARPGGIGGPHGHRRVPRARHAARRIPPRRCAPAPGRCPRCQGGTGRVVAPGHDGPRLAPAREEARA